MANIEGEPRYHLSSKRMMIAATVDPLLEIPQAITKIHEVMREPFDITNHAGNMWVGAVVAIGAGIVYSEKKEEVERSSTISAESMNHFRKYGIAAVCGATALVNCITETRWGIRTFPVARALGGVTPDILDTIYSTAYAGIVSCAIWQRRRNRIL